MRLLRRKLVRDARRQWVQLAAVSVTLLLGVAVFVATFDSYDNLKNSYAETYRQLGFADVTVSGGDTAALAGTLASTPGVAQVGTRTIGDVPFRVGGTTLLGRVVGTPTQGADLDRLRMEQGRSPTGDGAVVEKHMADHFHLAVGDTVEVYADGAWQTVPVVGVAVSPEYLWPARSSQDLLSSPDDFGVLFVTPARATQLAGTAAVDQVVVGYAGGADRAATDRRVRAAADAAGAADVVTQANQPSNNALQADVEGFRELSVLFPLLFLVASAMAAHVLLNRLVRTQRSQIGMLVANGMPTRTLLGHYLQFGALTGVVGGVVGAGVGAVLAGWVTGAYTSTLGIPVTVTRVRPVTILVAVGVGVAVGIVSAVSPARAAARTSPAEAMRGTTPVTGGAGLLGRLGLARHLPLQARLPLRSIERSPRRSLSTGLGVALAAVLILVSMGMSDTTTRLLDQYYGHIQRNDAQLYLAAPADGALVRSAGDIAGVAAAEPSEEAPVIVSHGSERYTTALQGFEPGTTMHQLPAGTPTDGGVVLGSALEGRLGIAVGDRVTLAVPGGSSTVLRVDGFVSEPLGSPAYTTTATAEALSGGRGHPSLLVRYQPGADTAAVERSLRQLPGVLAFRSVQGQRQAVEQLLSFFNAIVYVMLLFGGLLAFALLFNTLTVNLAERSGELAALQASGVGRRTLARLVTTEHVFLAAAALPVGLLAGWWLAGRFMASFNSDLYHFDMQFQPRTPVLVVVVLLAVSALSYLPAVRAIGRTDIATVVRERSG